MKVLSKIVIFFLVGSVFLLGYSVAWSSELIEPTRTLESTGEKLGKFTVSSGPPRLDVKMDGTVIGETPVVLQEVEPGIHIIRIKDSETEIFIAPGKSIQLSWFKGAFIEIPEEVKKDHKQQREEKKKTSQKRKSEQYIEKEKNWIHFTGHQIPKVLSISHKEVVHLSILNGSQ
jgi:hypothetical protein